MATGAELFVDTLGRLGINDIFTLVGDHLNDVLPAAARAGMRIVDMRHESGVAHAAESWARLQRRPALSLVTGGPGHTNSLTGIAAAHLACSPLIAVSGSRSSKMTGRGAFQDIDHTGMVRPVVKWAAEAASPEQIPFLLSRAYAEANGGRKGPVHLNVPFDVFGANATSSSVASAPALPAPAGVDDRAIAKALGLLQGAERPIVIAGDGVWWADAGLPLRRFIEKLSLPLFTIMMGRGVVPDDHPLCFGYADPSLNRAALTAFRQADVVLVIGKRLDYRLAFGGPRLFAPEARFIQIDIHQPELGLNRALDVAICADAAMALEALAAGPTSNREAWLTEIRSLTSQYQSTLSAQAQDWALPLHPAAFFAELARHLPAETRYSWDGGDFIHWGRAMLPCLHAGGWLRLGPLGAIGSGLPNSVALKMAHPDRPVVMITGDGSFGFYIAEIDSLVRHGLPVIFIIGNDGGWGLERELQGESGHPTIACELLRTRYDLITTGFGGAGEVIDTLDQVGPAMRRALESRVPYCLNVMVRGARSPFTEWQLDGKKR